MTTASPFVKWAGGKRQILAQIRRRLPKTMETYYEPFVGGGAVLFALANRKAFKRAVINDPNKELMDTYLALATGKVKDIVDILIDYPNTREFYNEIRDLNPVGIPELELRVARFLYLNKTCFTPGSLVLTEDENYVEIEKVQVGARLWGGRVVQEVLTQPYTDTIIRIRLQSNPFTASVTKDHPFLTITGKPRDQKQDPRTTAQLLEAIMLKPAADLREGDFLFLPSKGTVEARIDWMSFWPLNSTVGPQAKEPSLDLTDELGICRLLGYYAAEGNPRFQYGQVAGVQWTFNKDEPQYIQDVVSICQATFGLTPSVYPQEGESVCIQLQSVHVSRFIHALVPGQTWAKDPTQRKTKHLNKVLMKAPISLQLEILKGWFRGDAGLKSNLRMGLYSLTGTCTVIPMAHQMYRLAQRCGLRPSWWVTNPKTKTHPKGEPAAQVALCIRDEINSLGFDLPPMNKKSCPQRKFIGGYIAVRIKKITPLEYSGIVHNLEVDGDHLLCVDGIISHNCFNGLYRVNQSGGFNTPYGKYPNPNICDTAGLQEAARALQGVTVECGDFATSVAEAKSGDVVYFDPPYLPKSETANFTSYTEGGFTLLDHERLARTFRELAERGVSVLLSNADVKKSRELYAGFRISRIQARRNINSDGEKRGEVNELLIGANLPPMTSL